MLGLLAQLLPIDPQVAIDATKAAYDGFEKNFVVATVVSLVVSHGLWIWAYSRKSREVDRVQEKRVQDGKDWSERMATHLDRNTEMAEALVRKAAGL